MIFCSLHIDPYGISLTGFDLFSESICISIRPPSDLFIDPDMMTVIVQDATAWSSRKNLDDSDLTVYSWFDPLVMEVAAVSHSAAFLDKSDLLRSVKKIVGGIYDIVHLISSI